MQIFDSNITSIELGNQVKRQAVATPGHCVDSNPHESFSCSLGIKSYVKRFFNIYENFCLPQVIISQFLKVPQLHDLCHSCFPDRELQVYFIQSF